MDEADYDDADYTLGSENTERKRKRDKTESASATTSSTASTPKKPESAVKYHCNYCNKDVSTCVRVKCAVCQDFDLCMECFAVGVEMGNGHRKDHDYFVVDTLTFPFFEEDWGADEELLLLEGIEMYGMSNWGDVSEHVGKKSLAQCKDHYYKFYIHSPSAPFPDFSQVLTTTETLKQKREQRLLQLQERAGRPEVPVEEEKEQKYSGSQKAPPQSLVGGHSVAELAGWLAGRGDFETEHENSAETYLMDLAFYEDDSIPDRDMKLKLIEIYNTKLDERAFRKKFILERKLFDYKKLDKQRKDDKDIHDRLKTFGKVMTAEEHDKLFEGLVAERKLRRRIEQLKHWRMVGIHSLAEGEVYESEKKKRDLSGSRKRDASYGLDRSRASKTIASRVAKEAEMEAWQAQLKTKPRKPGAPLDLAGSPGVELLSDSERDLCSQLRLAPQQYALVKDTLLREYSRVGAVTKQSARQLIKMDVNKTSRVFDFLEGNGWINKNLDLSNCEPPIMSPPLSPAGTRYGPPGTPAGQMTPEQYAQTQQHLQQQQYQQLHHQQQQMLALKTAVPGAGLHGAPKPPPLIIPQPAVQHAPPVLLPSSAPGLLGQHMGQPSAHPSYVQR